uniref:Uncharacterized protein n=1 Tax=Octactis speculum TaxID=3111310 RepID=A0A7S2CUB3_9STRA|mmetsp:Transcript_39757/g.54102  ORF Transcript_39757/g.54102 Transcript_39757/m.54102 type:complete len:232 (+) Transcript_39757:71-766(+)
MLLCGNRGAARRNLRSFVYSCILHQEAHIRVRVFCKLSGLSGKKYDGSVISCYMVPILTEMFTSPNVIAAAWTQEEMSFIEASRFKTLAITKPCGFFLRLLPFGSDLVKSAEKEIDEGTVKIRKTKMISLDVALKTALPIWEFLQIFVLFRRKWAARKLQVVFRRRKACQSNKARKRLSKAQELDRKISQDEAAVAAPATEGACNVEAISTAPSQSADSNPLEIEETSSST